MLYAHFYQIIECQSISLLLHSHDFACMAGGTSGKSMAVEIALTPNAKR